MERVSSIQERKATAATLDVLLLPFLVLFSRTLIVIWRQKNATAVTKILICPNGGGGWGGKFPRFIIRICFQIPPTT